MKSTKMNSFAGEKNCSKCAWYYQSQPWLQNDPISKWNRFPKLHFFSYFWKLCFIQFIFSISWVNYLNKLYITTQLLAVDSSHLIGLYFLMYNQNVYRLLLCFGQDESNFCSLFQMIAAIATYMAIVLNFEINTKRN